MQNKTHKKIPLDEFLMLQEKIRNQISQDSPEPDEFTSNEQADLTAQKQRAEIQGLHQDTEERKKYAELIFKLICYWLCGIFLLILLQGLCSIQNYNFISDKVLITIIGGTTVNILGLLVIVLKYLFKERKF